MWSSHRGNLDAVRLLLNTNQIDFNLRNRGGYTALMLAKFNNCYQVVELLKKAGAEE